MKYKFNPDKDEGGNTNQSRSDRAESVMQTYVEALGDASQYNEEDTMADLLADLRHFCDDKEIDFDAALKSATVNWEAER